MNICVVSGSPKGQYSITLQTVLYLEKRFPEHTFEYLHAGQRIRSLEGDLAPALDMLGRAGLILFCYPVYTFIAPAQLHRFIELVKQSGADLSSKLAAQVTTSKHFYDVTARRYIEENCADMGLMYLGGLSADMEDLLKESGQRDAERFFEHILWRAQNDVPVLPKRAVAPSGAASAAPLPYERSLADTPKLPGRGAVIVTDLARGGSGLRAMIEDFRAAYPHASEVVDLAEYPFKGGCLGCFNCAADGRCIYNDGFDSFLRERIQTADCIVYAFHISDHSMGPRFKLYDDRQFCNGHRTVTMGMPVGSIISGDYAGEANLRMIIEGRADVGGNFLAGVATDAAGISSLARELDYALEHRFTLPQTFLGVGGMKIFRDLIWLMRGLMKADHRFYKEHGFYDFPQKQRGTLIKMQLVGALMTNKKVKAKIGNRMNEGMIAPYKKVLDSAAKE